MLRDILRERLREALREVLQEELRDLRSSPPCEAEGSGRQLVAAAGSAKEVAVQVFGKVAETLRPIASRVGWEGVRLGFALAVGVAWHNREYICEKVRAWWNPPVRAIEMPPQTLPDIGGPEAMVANSECRTAATGIPSFIAKVAVRTESEGQRVYRAIGNCVRVNSVIFMPKHLTEQGAVYILSNNEANMAADKNTKIEYDEDNDVVSCVDDDLLMVKLSEQEMSVLGMKKPSICPVPVGISVQCTAYSRALGQSSSGAVMQSAVFGVVAYTGSTTKGWSGGAYVMGTRLLGMHYYGNPNKGYAASYLEFIQRVGVPESSEEWFYAELERLCQSEEDLRRDGRVRDWGVDEVDYRDSRGQFHRLDRVVYNKAMNRWNRNYNPGGYSARYRDDYDEDEVRETYIGSSHREGAAIAAAPAIFVQTPKGEKTVIPAPSGNAKTGGKSSDSSPPAQSSLFSRKERNLLTKMCDGRSPGAVIKLVQELSSKKQ